MIAQGIVCTVNSEKEWCSYSSARLSGVDSALALTTSIRPVLAEKQNFLGEQRTSEGA